MKQKEIQINGQTLYLKDFLISFERKEVVFIFFIEDEQVSYQIIQNKEIFKQYNLTDKNQVNTIVINGNLDQEFVQYLNQIKNENFKFLIKNNIESNDSVNIVQKAIQSLPNNLNKYFPGNFPDIYDNTFKVQKGTNLPFEYINITNNYDYDLSNQKYQMNEVSLNYANKKLQAYQSIHYNKQQIEQETFPLQYDFTQANPKISFLGTGAMTPLIFRNVSCIYVEEPTTNVGMMFDCGEGSYLQLIRQFGVDLIEQKLINLQILFITHVHLDHQMGFLQILSKRQQALQKNKSNKQIYLCIPNNMGYILKLYEKYLNRDLLENVKVIFNQDLLKIQRGEQIQDCENQQKVDLECTKIIIEHVDARLENYQHPQEMLINSVLFKNKQNIINEFKCFLNENKIQRFTASPTVHCPDSCGIIVKYQNDIQISYTGDCRPTVSFAKEAQKSTVLIHEATFDDSLLTNAQQNMHSTIREAAEIGHLSQAEYLVLTHFSQRYTSLDLKQQAETIQNQEIKEYLLKNSILAFDHLQFSVSDVPGLVEESHNWESIYQQHFKEEKDESKNE